MAASIAATTFHTTEFFERRSCNDPARDLNLAFVRDEMLNRLSLVTKAATDSVPGDRAAARRDCRTVLHYVDPEKASKEWCADPEANKSAASYVGLSHPSLCVTVIVADSVCPSLHPVWGPVDKGVPAVVEDVRGRETELTLERNGQVWVNHKSSMTPVDYLDNVRNRILCGVLWTNTHSSSLSPDRTR